MKPKALKRAKAAGYESFSFEPYERVKRTRGDLPTFEARMAAVTEIIHAEINPFERGSAVSNAFIDGWNKRANEVVEAVFA